MATKGVLVCLVLAIFCCSKQQLVNGQGLSVTITVDYNPPPGFFPGPNEYRAASGPASVACRATEETGTETYQWSSTCRKCPFQTARSKQLERFVHVSDTGTHTCTVTRDGITANASIEFIIVGAGILVFTSSISRPRVNGSLPNNGLLVSVPETAAGSHRFRFYCRSDSTTENVGQLIGLNGNIITSNNYFNVNHGNLPGQLGVLNTVGSQDALPVSEQGIYTCRIPLQSEELKEINIGIYLYGFSTLPSILKLEYDPTNKTLICTSTGSPPTTVTWIRDGQQLTIDGSTYQLTQTVINRRESTYKNMLIINELISYHRFQCRVTNALGSSNYSEEVQTLYLPTIINLEFYPKTQTLTCTVNATTVTWLKDGQPLIDGSNTTRSIEPTFSVESVLTFNLSQSKIVDHTYTCIASSSGIRGISSKDFTIVIPPVMSITATAVNGTAVNVSWIGIEHLGWNVSHYSLNYTIFSAEETKKFSRLYPANTISVMVHLLTQTESIYYEFYVSANVGIYEGPQSEKARIVLDQQAFQLQIGPVEHCISWQSEKARRIEDAIQTAIVNTISNQCGCNFPHHLIRKGRFSCRNITTEATYRSTIAGTVSNNASQLVNFIQNWVHFKPTIEVDWYLLDVYSNCPVRITSLTGPECQVTGPNSSDQTLITSDPMLIRCVNICLYRQRGENICRV